MASWTGLPGPAEEGTTVTHAELGHNPPDIATNKFTKPKPFGKKSLDLGEFLG